MARREAILALADGTVFRGRAFGAEGETAGELVFNTSMTGYQEILTDPSYHGQLVAMTYPQIGNVGVNREDVESTRPWVRGFIVREYREAPSSWRAEQSLGAYLAHWGIPGIEGIDTRALVRRLRDHGAQEAVLSSVDLDAERLVRKAKDTPSLVGRDLVREVTCSEPYGWEQGPWKLGGYLMAEEIAAAMGRPPFKVVAYDYGIKWNILRNLVGVGCAVRVVPASTPAGEVLALDPDGVFLSNGPGDPDAVAGARENVARLLGKTPVFGICLGHQILGLALGGSTYKLKFGHHGGNQPVQDLTTGKVEITSQNHGFAVDLDSLRDRAEITHLNLNDRTCEGLVVRDQPTFSVQYHPEASPGPHDARYLFRRFTDLMTHWRRG
ncbi:MAG: glutamine-hydrolyzing carbamoyl-phosphate synthase small subunit [bacterium]|nr:glutamine-hydrolyzing carbamoyl-phosphate synthase small subunit [bacterium]